MAQVDGAKETFLRIIDCSFPERHIDALTTSTFFYQKSEKINK